MLFTGLLAFAVFCIVQDVATVAGARRYVRLQREALAGRGPAVTVDEVMEAAVDRSVRQGLVYGGMTAAIGALLALRARRRRSGQERPKVLR